MIELIASLLIAGALVAGGYHIACWEARRSVPLIAKESALDDLDQLLDTVRALTKLLYASKGGTVDVHSAHLTETAAPDVLRTAFKSFVQGIGDVLGIAPVRRPVQEVDESYRVATSRIKQAIEVAKGRG